MNLKLSFIQQLLSLKLSEGGSAFGLSKCLRGLKIASPVAANSYDGLRKFRELLDVFGYTFSLRKFSIVVGIMGVCFGLEAYALLAKRTQVHMGTFVSISLPAGTKGLVFTESFAKIAALDKTLSSFKKDSEISQLNRLKTLRVSNPTLKLLLRSFEVSELTEGAFDITVGVYTKKLYAFGSDHPNIPSPSALVDAQKHVGWKRIKINGNRVTLAANMLLDLGAIGKGFVVQKVARALRKRGILDGVVAASGDIYCLAQCNIIIQNPLLEGDGLLEFRTQQSNLAISTSGSYGRTVPGTKAHHLLNPKTGNSSSEFASITLVTLEDSTLIDALATGLSILKLPKALKILNKIGNVGYFLVGHKGDIWLNSKFLSLVGQLNWKVPKASFRIHRDSLTHLQ